jgi:hypothetical protein
MAYINTRKYDEAIYWIDRTEMLLKKYGQKPDARTEYFDEYQGRIEIMRAVAREGLGKEEEAAKAYQAFLKTNYSKTPAGHINATDYLIAAKRYKEAAYNYVYLEQALKQWGMGLTLDNIQLYLLPKYEAFNHAGQTDSAQSMGAFILSVLDSIITDQKDNTASELATIYHTNQKDAQIVQQQADMQRTRWISTMAILALLTFFFTIYTLYRRKAQKKLAAANQKLEEGNIATNAVVTIEFMNLSYQVLGETNHSGRFSITKDKVTIVEALSSAGDMTLYGMRDSVIVMREQNGERHTYVVNMLSGKDILESPAYYIQQGDVIYVKHNNYRRRQSTANASEVTTASFWLSALSVLATLSVLIFK